MRDFEILLNIDKQIGDVFGEIERYFKISLDKTIIKRILKEAEEDQVSIKEYLIFKGAKKIFSKQIIIQGIVDEYEPETIRIEFKNVNKRDVKHFSELFTGYGHGNF